MSDVDTNHCKICGAKLRVTQTRLYSWRICRTRVCPTPGCKADLRETSEIPNVLLNYLLAEAGKEWDKLTQSFVEARSKPASQPDTAQPVADYAAPIAAEIKQNLERKKRGPNRWDDWAGEMDREGNAVDPDGNRLFDDMGNRIG